VIIESDKIIEDEINTENMTCWEKMKHKCFADKSLSDRREIILNTNQ